MTDRAISKEIAQAISDVMGGIKILKKEERNKFDNYNFASIDDFLAMVNPLCSQAGLIILQDEISCEMVEGKKRKDGTAAPWLSLQFDFTLVHKSGAACPGGKRTVMVPANGAQAFGSAQSYSLKQFMRSLFQIPTGDKDDADLMRSEEMPKSAYAARKEGDYPKIESEIRAHTNPDELKAWGIGNKDRLTNLPDNWRDHARDEYERHMKEISS